MFLLSLLFICGVSSFLFEGVWSNKLGESIELALDDEGGFYGAYASIVKPNLGIYDLKGLVEYECFNEGFCLISFSVIWNNEYTMLNSSSSWNGIIKDGEIDAWRTTVSADGAVALKKDVFKRQKLINIFENFM